MFITTRDVIYSSFAAPRLPLFRAYPRNIVLLDLIRTRRLHELLSDCGRGNKLTGPCEIFIRDECGRLLVLIRCMTEITESEVRDWKIKSFRYVCGFLNGC